MQDSFLNPHNAAVDDLTKVVKVTGSYDMAWPTKGNGHSYDSLFGYGTVIGVLSKLIMEYYICIRKCRMCDLGRPPWYHDCKLNYYGSAKGMEPHAAIKAILESIIFQECNIELGILVMDNDSSTITNLRQSTNLQIIKQSDFNHTSKGVKKTYMWLKLE